MSDERTRRIGQNEALYRQVNERIEDLNETFAANTDGVFTIVCECGDLECMERMAVPRVVYEQTRTNPVHFIVKPGHDAQDVEHVVESHGDYAILEKKPGAAQRIAEETDTRG